MKNPCRDCEHLPESKNGPVCMQCDKRIEYVRSLGDVNDMQPLLGINGGGKTVSVGADYDAGKEYLEMGETKICSRPDCEHNGEPQPLSNFDKNKGYADGMTTICKDCRRRYQRKRDGGKRKYTKKVDLAEIVQGPARPETAAAGGPYIITIDLSETPELYHQLAEREAIDIIMNALR